MAEKEVKPVFETLPGIIPEAYSTIKKAGELTDAEIELNKKGFATKEDQMYGHAARSLVQTMYSNESKSPEEQKRILRARAERLIDQYGEGIKKVLAQELLEVLGIK